MARKKAAADPRRRHSNTTATQAQEGGRQAAKEKGKEEEGKERERSLSACVLSRAKQVVGAAVAYVICSDSFSVYMPQKNNKFNSILVQFTTLADCLAC